MKKIIVLLYLVCLAHTGYSQNVRLGFSWSEIWDEFRYGYQIEALEPGSKTNYKNIHITMKDFNVAYGFDNDGFCNLVAVFPNTSIGVQTYAEYLNQTYAIISPTKWRWYHENGIVDIEFRRSDNMTFFTYIKRNDL